MENSIIENIAKKLIEAKKRHYSIEPISDIYPEITVSDAYEIQEKQVKYEISRNHKVIGKKIGLTSHAMQSMMNIGEPDFGHLFDDMLVEEGNEIKLETLISPMVEGEIAFILKEDLKGPGITSKDVDNQTLGISPAIEIIDSRIKDWKIKIQDTIADNASSGLFVVSKQITTIKSVDLRSIKLSLFKNGSIISDSVASVVLGNPSNAVAWLANKMAEFGVYLKKNDIILSGSLVKAEPVKKGDNFSAIFDTLGSVTCTFS